MSVEEEAYNRIIKDSQQKILALELLANFFNHKDLFAALIKTKIIHRIFDSNKDLDINKLELFHIQYTSSLVDLFRKLKKKKEQQYLLMTDEMHIHDDLIGKLQGELGESRFPEQMKQHGKLMSQKLQQLYNMLLTDKNESFSWNEITNVSNSNRSEYYREITPEQYAQLCGKVEKSFYQNNFARFEKKLLGRLNILQFRVKFVCGLYCGDQIVEVYEFRDSNDLFVFITSSKSFVFLDPVTAAGLDLSKNVSAKQEVIHQLVSSNGKLKEQLGNIKTSMPENVKAVLVDYVSKISSVNFVNDLQNVDEQTNILKSMLNININ